MPLSLFSLLKDLVRIWIDLPVLERHVHIEIIFGDCISNWKFDLHAYWLICLKITHGKFNDCQSWLIISFIAVVLVKEHELDVACEQSVLHNECIERCSVFFGRTSIVIFIVKVLWMNWNDNLLVPDWVSGQLLRAACLRVHDYSTIILTSVGV